MIAYDLQCSSGHSFEGWFEDALAYKDQQKRGLVTCPVCNDTRVSRIPSTFAIKASQNPTSFPAKQNELDKIGMKIVDFVQKNFDDVGCNFAKEALKIHYGAVEPRNIRGVSTKEEEKTLEEEGIEFFKIPMPVSPDTDA
jgi:hypothetical protein